MYLLFFFVSLKIIFEGTVGRSYTGDIAIDDIHLENGPCRGFELSLPNDTETKRTGKKLKVILMWPTNAHDGKFSRRFNTMNQIQTKQN